MLEIKDIKVCNWENAIRGMRHPLESYDRSDSIFCDIFKLGENDKKLMKKLIKSGSDHRKFMRQILVSFDITAPLYWWKEMDTYKIGTVSNSTSSMHTIHKKCVTDELFSLEDTIGVLSESDAKIVYDFLKVLETLRFDFNTTNNKKYWRALIQLLPSSLNQTRMVTLNYEVLLNMYNSRKDHKLSEWHTFCDVILTLPYFKELIGVDE